MTTCKNLSLALACLGWSALGAPAAFALPLPSALEAAAPKVAPPAASLEAAGIDFTAIVALNNCSGSLVRFNDSKPADKAMILTNGHCFEGGLLKANEVILDKATQRTFKLLNSKGSATIATLRADRLLYATMTGTDLALYRLKTTYGEIAASYGVDALTISDKRVTEGTPIHVVSGYWKRIYSCSVDRFVYQLKESEWTFSDSILYQQPGCKTIGGTSGSPIINAVTKEVVGVNNTGNEDGARCTFGNPCEVDEEGKVTVTRDAAYGQQVFQLYACLDAGHAIDLNRAACELARPRAAFAE